MWRWQRPGYRRCAVAIAYPDAPPTLVAGRFQEEISLIRAWTRDVTTFADYLESPLTRAAEVLTRRQRGSGRIGIETHYLTAEFGDDLTTGLAQAEIVSCDDLLAGVWASRNPAELALMRQNVERLSRIVATTVAQSQAGERERSVHQRLIAAIRLAGGSEGWGRTIAGERRRLHGALPSEQSLAGSELVLLEYACAFRTYPARVGRMAVVGEPRAADQERYTRYVQALATIASQLGPSQAGGEIFQRTEQGMQAAGFTLRGSTVGNALDIAYYGRPTLAPGEPLPTKPGMLLSLEPETDDGLKASLLLEITRDGTRQVPDALPPLDQLLPIAPAD
jgi:Xaa-Pro aminopeptidase